MVPRRRESPNKKITRLEWPRNARSRKSASRKIAPRVPEKCAKQKVGFAKNRASSMREIRKAGSRLQKFKKIKSENIVQNIIKNENKHNFYFKSE